LPSPHTPIEEELLKLNDNDEKLCEKENDVELVLCEKEKLPDFEEVELDKGRLKEKDCDDVLLNEV